MIDWSNFKNFSESEFACRGHALGLCDCGGRADMRDRFMDSLQQIRNGYARPMVITSGFRCPDYNAQISTTGRTGPHTKGRAADIKVSGSNTYHLMGSAYALDMRGIGLKQHGPMAGRYMHLDDLGGRTRPRVWSYS